MEKKEYERKARELEAVLGEFKVQGKVTRVSSGPVVTLFEFKPASNIKSSRVIGLSDDIARVMSAVSCRAAIIPGRDVIGIELPNPTRKTVHLDRLLQAPQFLDGPENLPWALGADIGGETVIVDIAKMPHLLMAGTTGSGKSVAMNTLIVSILSRLEPEFCKFIMIDPKQLELAVYADIPHLLAPIVTDSTKAIKTLRWTVREMEDRYLKMAKAGVRNITGYNEGNELHMPYIIVVIDEVADLMMVAGKEIEAVIQRLAQMARAAGIHVIMATQRPSVDVITGTIKANFPTRVSFQVISKFDSTTILGEQGAEKLLGMGDMLYMSGGGKIRRVHGAFMSDEDVVKFTDVLRLKGKPTYAEELSDKPAATPESAVDSQYDHAVRVVLEDGRASAAYIQRKLGISYYHAMELTMRMEQAGIVGPPDVGGRREVLIPFKE